MNYGKEFRSFAKSEGISSLVLDQFEASLTPYILEEREMRVTQMDIFSRLMRDRILWLSGCLLYTSPSPRDRQKSRMPSSA